MAFRLSKRAASDLRIIYDRSVSEFGQRQADKYVGQLQADIEYISEYPESVREQKSRLRLIRVLPSGSHVIAFVIEAPEQILIIRLLHGRQDWINIV